MRKIIYLTIILLFHVLSLLKAQDFSGDIRNSTLWDPLPDMQYGSTKDFMPVSPRAASLGIFGQIPVGNYTGTAEISIPLYEIKHKDLSVPISVSYHASGVKPDLFPGPVGLGWSLQCGGVITRVIKGSPDYGAGPEDETNGEHLAQMPDPRINDDWSSDRTLKEYVYYHDYLLEGTSDPDEFYFNFNGHVGRFYVDHTGAFRVQSDKGETFRITQISKPSGFSGKFKELPQTVKGAMRIENKTILVGGWPPFPIVVQDTTYYDPDSEIIYNPNINIPLMITGFELTDTKGIKYKFGGSFNSIEFSRNGLREFQDIDDGNMIKYIQPTSWYLVSIESPNGYKIEFSYEQETYITQVRFTDYVISRYTIYNVQTGAVGASKDRSPSLSVNTVDGTKATLINGCYLKEVTFPSGKVKFKNSIASEQLIYEDYSPFHPMSPTQGSRAYIDSKYFQSMNNHYNSFYNYPDVKFANTKKLLNGTTDTNWETARNRFLPHKVDAFEVYNNNSGEWIKKVDFSYTTNRLQRMKLTDIKIRGKAYSGLQTYSFQYNPLYTDFYLSQSTDYYGFQNNGSFYLPDDNPSGVFYQEIQNDCTLFYQMKKPSTAHYMNDMLVKVIYPTKGYTQLEYEPHDYGAEYKTWPFRVENNPNGNINTGGPRIKKLSNYDFNGTKLTEKIYHYKKNYLNGGTASSGILAYTPKYHEKYEDVAIIKRYLSSGRELVSDSAFVHYFLRCTSNPIYPLMSTRGNHVTYSEVTVEEPGNGFKVYKYKNYDNGYHDNDLIHAVSRDLRQLEIRDTPLIKLWEDDEGISMKLERGQPLSEEIFDSNKNPKSKTEYFYNDDPNRFEQNVRYMKLSRNNIDLAESLRSYRIVAGLHYTYFPYLKKKKETLYLDKTVEKTQDFTYDEDYRLIRSVTSTDSENNSIKSTVSYPHDLSSSNGAYEIMKINNMINYPVEQNYFRSNEFISKVNYSFSENLLIDGMIAPFPHQKKVKYAGTDEYTESTITKYDTFGNPVNIIGKDNNSTCILWGYKGQYPIAEIKNISYEQLKSVIGESLINSIAGEDDPYMWYPYSIMELRTDARLKDALISTYTYEPLVGVKTMTDPRGITTYYDYDGLGRLKETYIMEDGKKKSVQSYEYHYQNH
ncbi:YD repeat-containing protein [Dysgonomonas sp. PFB1-18]|uniref:hypothetical protein n=1 Tax=unclassified Dysgonomonas TaxID=2630389 RepID=UPI00247696D4|nr:MULTISPECIES: hypothetical protein [unclassified Dysgonomonas]MDH6309445.1 YD repeat-containing protein [Dysgonomonas sp. PF1-14]MDH6339690.1 YD repeat-containing protein [Dysgonomonas sp. PF1-16]MDH6381338.1 YD repeat-containing protein [Dysgonomonas sp. PFB1-18]MDH6398553.1 YD repeat-containing protein [Dysgonomonas sp. PF1-23]